MDLAPRMVAQLAAALPRAAEAAPYAAAQLAAPYLAPLQAAPQVYGVQAPGQAPGPVDTFEPTNPPPYIALQNPFTENDKWLIPVIVVAAVGIFLGLTAGAVRWARRMGVPIRG